MERSEKIKESQYLWEFEKEGMLQSNKERYEPLIEVLDPLFKSGVVTYDEWIDHFADTFKKYAVDSDDKTLRKKAIEQTIDDLIQYYKQF